MVSASGNSFGEKKKKKKRTGKRQIKTHLIPNHTTKAAICIATNDTSQQLGKLYHKLLHTEREGGRIKQNLSLFGQETQQLFHHDNKVLRQQFVSLITIGEGRKCLVLTDSV